MQREYPIWDWYQVVPPVGRSIIVRLRHNAIWHSIPEVSSTVFVHIPKTGGTTLAFILYGQSINHYPIWVWRMANKRRFEQCTVVVTVLRDPFDRLVSAVRHCLGGDLASKRDLAAGLMFRRNASSIDEMIECYLQDQRIRDDLSGSLMFKPYRFWLGKREMIPNLRCFALVKGSGDFLRDGLRLNENKNIETMTGSFEMLRKQAREVLREDYSWYDDPRNETVHDVNEIPIRLGLSKSPSDG